MLCITRGKRTLLGKSKPALHPALIYLHYTRKNVQSDYEYGTQRIFQFPGGAKYGIHTLRGINVKKGQLTLFFFGYYRIEKISRNLSNR